MCRRAEVYINTFSAAGNHCLPLPLTRLVSRREGGTALSLYTCVYILLLRRLLTPSPLSTSRKSKMPPLPAAGDNENSTSPAGGGAPSSEPEEEVWSQVGACDGEGAG